MVVGVSNYLIDRSQCPSNWQTAIHLLEIDVTPPENLPLVLFLSWFLIFLLYNPLVWYHTA
jgi:hypothetical protein